MVRVVDSKYTFWLAGYYDDFTSAKAVPDDLNKMDSSWFSSKTHHGNPLNGFAPYNPRYKYAFFIRNDAQGGSGRFNGASMVSVSICKTHNPRLSSWLTMDEQRYNTIMYDAVSQLQYPDSKTNANRQRFDKTTGASGTVPTANPTYKSADAKEGYMLICNGYNTEGLYYAFTGENDSSYGRAVMDKAVFQTQDMTVSTGGVTTQGQVGGSTVDAATMNWNIRTNMVGVYMGEVIRADDCVFTPSVSASNFNPANAGALGHLLPISSPSKSNFLVQEIYADSTYRSGAYFPTLAYTNTLNCKGDGDIFTFRVACLVNSNKDALSTGPAEGVAKLSFGATSIAISSSATEDNITATYAVSLELDQLKMPLYPDLTSFTPSFIETQLASIWTDYDFKLDFTSQTYQLYKNGAAVGSSTAFNAKPDGSDWLPSDFKGWLIETKNTDTGMVMCYDRVGVVRPVSEVLGGNVDEYPVVDSFNYQAGVNQHSTFNMTIIDDDSKLKLTEFFNQSSYSNWSLLCFRDNIDRPFWRGFLNSLNYKFNANSRTPKISLGAEDYLNSLDHEVPIWELGQGGDADSTSVVSYNRQEAQTKLDAYYFGANSLKASNSGLGYNEVLDGSGVFLPRADSRMRSNSAHPIQMYLGEDEFGTNEPYTYHDYNISVGYSTADAQERVLHSRWVKDIGNSAWFRHMFGRIKESPKGRFTLTSNFNVGDTTLTLSNGGELLENGGHIEFANGDSGVVTSATVPINWQVAVGWLYYWDIKGQWNAGYTQYTETVATAYTDAPNGHTFGDFTNSSFNMGSSPQNGRVVGVVFIPTANTSELTLNHTITNCQWDIFNQTWEMRRQNKVDLGGTEYWIYALFKPQSGFNLFSNGSIFSPDLRFLSAISNPFPIPKAQISGSDKDLKSSDGLSAFNSNLIQTGLVGLSQYTFNLSGVGDAVVAWLQQGGGGAINFRANFSHGSNPVYNTFISAGNSTIGTTNPTQNTTFASATIRAGTNTTVTLPSTNFFEKNHSSGEVVSILDIDDDYKHMYVMWSDMRNDGNANACGGQRKNSFGLLKPSADNYSVSLVFADTETSGDGEREAFVDLAIGQDVDLWELGSTDPITGNRWSALPTIGSNAESNSKYHDWEDKAGSFILVDSSKFFNLNTYSNGGRSGQISGGKKEIGDFIVETEGFPILLDNYWKRAMPTPENIDPFRAWSPYYNLYFNEPMSLRESIKVGDRCLQLLPNSPTIHFGGFLVSNKSSEYPTTIKLVSHSKEKVFHANVYQKLTGSTGLSYNQSTAGVLTITVPVAEEAYLLRKNHFITVENATHSALNNTYLIDASSQTNTTRTFTINLQDSTSSVGNGTLDITMEDTYAFFNLVDLGAPTTGANQPGQWDGSAYDGIRMSSAFLTGGKSITTNAGSSTITVNSHRFDRLGFKRGMTIDISGGTLNDGRWLITGMSGTGVITVAPTLVGQTLATETASTSYTISSSTFNPNSAEYLVNSFSSAGVITYPSISNPNPATGLARSSTSAGATINIPIGDDENAYDDMTIYQNASSVYPMRLMMQIDGYVKDKSSVTFNDSDKFRMTYIDSLTQNWFNQSRLYGIHDIGSIPLTGDMNISQKSAIGEGRGSLINTIVAGNGSGGSIGSQNTISTLGGINHGLSVGDSVEIIDNDALSGATNRTTYTVVGIPTATTYTVETTNTNYTPTGKGRWVKVGMIDNFGSINDCRNTSILNIFSQVQQAGGVGESTGARSVFSYLMGRDSKPSYRPTYSNGFIFNHNNIRVSELSAENNTQITNVRVFYSGDGSFVDFPSTSLGAKPRWEIIQAPNITSSDEALAVAKQTFEKQRKAPLSINCKITNIGDRALQQNDSNMLLNARYGYISDPARAILGYNEDGTDAYNYLYRGFWTHNRGGTLFSGVNNALDGLVEEYPLQHALNYQGSDLSATTTNTPATENYFWYGANSVSYAVQVVHIPHGMPKTSQAVAGTGLTKGDGQLRVIITLTQGNDTNELTPPSNDDNGNLLFQINLCDYTFVADPAKTVGAKNAGVGSAWSSVNSSVQVDSNGLYEVAIPTSYWADATGNERIILSVNYDYLCSLVKLRCGGAEASRRSNAHSLPTVSGIGGFTFTAGKNTKSIFPLGARKWSAQGAGTVQERWFGYLHRAEWYAPRIQITDDLNFVPATTLKYTDERINLTDEPMSIKSLNWQQSNNESEKLSLKLERDVSRAAKTFASYILPKVNFGRPQRFNGGGGGGNRGGGSNKGKDKEGTNKGNPKGGAWAAKYGDESPNAKSTNELVPITDPSRLRVPDGRTSAISSNLVIGSSALSTNLNNKIKGKMDIKDSNMLGDNFSLLGQKKPTNAPRDEHAHQSIDSFIIPQGGNAVMSNDGFTLGGRGEQFTAYASNKIHLRVPANSQSASIRITAKCGLSSDASESAILYITAICVETNSVLENAITITGTGDTSKQNITLLAGLLSGAEVSGNTIQVIIEREAGVGLDTAVRGGVTVSNVQLANDTRSVSGKSKSNEFSYSL